jgi:tetratricopeptide (TPR) repeat protein
MTRGAPQPPRGAGQPPPPPPGQTGPALPLLPPSALFSSQEPLTSPWQELAFAYLALPAPDPALRVQYLLEVSRVWDEGAGDVENAFEALADAAAINVEHIEVGERLAALAEKHDRFDRMLAIYLDEIDRAAEAATLIRLHFKVAELLLARKREAEAEEHFSAILAVQPDNQEAAERLRAILAAGARWQDLAYLQERQLEALSETLGAESRKERLRELADLYQHTLGRPFETVDFLTRLVAEDQSDLATQLRLADLYQELSIWPRLIETLQAVLERTTESADRVGHLLRVARTYEEELELPDRAIESYELVLGEQPTSEVALAALDRLYEEHDRPSDLIQVLRLRVDLADGDPEAGRQLLLRLARVIEGTQGEAGLAEAASCLERARRLGPLDPDIEEALGRVLCAAGRTQEAVDLLRERAESSRRDGLSGAEVAAILVRLARLQLGELADPGGARATLEDALAAEPHSIEALRALAELHHAREAWSDFIETQNRIVDLSSGGGDAAAMMIAAAVVARDRLRDDELAERLYERALECDPSSLAAIDVLLLLVGDDLERRESLLRLKLDLVEDAKLKASTLAQLGRVLHRRGAPPEAATVLYRQALALEPGCVPALDALSELLVAQGQLEDARELLTGALADLERSPLTGPLYFRLGQVFEQLDRSDEGYSYLSEALRLEPKNLLLRIAAGMNRFRAGAWRDTLRHLGEVADHPDAAAHAAEAAEAVFTAGRCEAILKRGARAVACWEIALRLYPDHLPSLRELAAAAREGGDLRRAAELLERQRALALGDDERRTLLRALGELYRDQLADIEAAAGCFSELVEHLPDDEATRLELLPPCRCCARPAATRWPRAPPRSLRSCSRPSRRCATCWSSPAPSGQLPAPTTGPRSACAPRSTSTRRASRRSRRSRASSRSTRATPTSAECSRPSSRLSPPPTATGRGSPRCGPSSGTRAA